LEKSRSSGISELAPRRGVDEVEILLELADEATA
jgi:hypothetical protein